MSPELDDRLCKAFPKLYAQRNLPMQATCMCWGFEVPEKWFPAIWMISAGLEALDEGIEAVQVKEKFGTLRFYTNFSSDEADRIIELGEELVEIIKKQEASNVSNEMP